jgi:hypothetical protein
MSVIDVSPPATRGQFMRKETLPIPEPTEEEKAHFQERVNTSPGH